MSGEGQDGMTGGMREEPERGVLGRSPFDPALELLKSELKALHINRKGAGFRPFSITEWA